MNKIISISLFLLIQLWANSQEKSNESRQIQGIVYDSTSKATLPFATVVNLATNIATITNSNGYFELSIQSYRDTLSISYVGYKKREFKLIKKSNYYKISLEVSSVNLSAVNIVPKDYSYIYDLLIACKKKKADVKKSSKAYYQLKSHIDGRQIELVENFYNARIKGYDLLSLKLKTGRVGLQKKDGTYFASLESSKPIQLHRLFSETNYFPQSPLELTKRGMKKNYYLELEKVYVDEHNDSIHIAILRPKNSKSYYFSAKLWINASDTNFIKVELSGKNLFKFPLVPVYHSDKLSDINLTITKTFQEIDGDLFFKHIDFNYDFLYTKYYGDSYRVKTEAVLFSYVYDQGFNLPFTYLNDYQLTDYQKLRAIPYNRFFWDNNDELRLHYENNSNTLFMQDPLTLGNERYQNQFSNDLGEIFNYPAINWDEKRFAFKELPQYIPYVVTQPTYKFKAEIFLDYNNYNDSIDILIQSIFDTYKSYFKLNVDNRTIDNTINCFINMYFDIVEIGKRRLQEAIKNSDKSWDAINWQYTRIQNNLTVILEDYLYDVGMGKNEQQMKSWNEYIKDKLDIDNLLIFQIYQEEETN